MPLHTTDDPGVRAAHVAEHEAREVWKRTGDGKLSERTRTYTYDEALRLFSEGINVKSRHHRLCCCHECGGAG